MMKLGNKFPNCLCSISPRQLELLLWRAGPTEQHLQDCVLFFIQLNYVHKSKNKVLPPYFKLPLPKYGTWDSTSSSLNQKSHTRQTLRGKCCAVGPALQSNSSNCLVLIPHRQLGNYLLHTGKT